MRASTNRLVVTIALLAILGAACAEGDERVEVSSEGAPVEQTATTGMQSLPLDPSGKFPGSLSLPATAEIEKGSPYETVADVPTDVVALQQLAEAEQHTIGAGGEAPPALSVDATADTADTADTAALRAKVDASSVQVPTYSVRFLRGDATVVDVTGASIPDIVDVTLTMGDAYSPEFIDIMLTVPDPNAQKITVRGKAAILIGPSEFGIGVGWQERPGLSVYVSLKSGNEAELLPLVEAMQF